MQIYPLERQRPVVVDLEINKAQIVISDGFHVTPPVEVSCQKTGIQHLIVSCSIEDDQLIIGLLLLFLFYTAGITSNLLAFKLLSFLLIGFFLYTFYIKKRNFISLRLVS